MSKPTILLGSTPVAAVVAEYKRLSDLAPDPVAIAFTPDDVLTEEQRESIRTFIAELGNRGLVVYKGIPIVPIEIVEKPL